MTEPLSTRQLLALSHRAKQRGDEHAKFGQGVIFAAGWLRLCLEKHQGDPLMLKAELQDNLDKNTPRWDEDEYDDGVAAVFDDIAAILDNDPDTIRNIIEYGRDRAKAEKEN